MCSKLGCACDVIDNDLELLIGDLGSNSRLAVYIHLRTNATRKGKHPSVFLLAMG